MKIFATLLFSTSTSKSSISTQGQDKTYIENIMRQSHLNGLICTRGKIQINESEKLELLKYFLFEDGPRRFTIVI